jgi:hypothetical protein
MKVETLRLWMTRHCHLRTEKDLRRHLDAHVALDLDLAGQAHAVLGLARRDEAGLGRHQRAAAFLDHDLAHAAGALAAAGGGQEDAVGGQRVEQRPAGLDLQRLGGVVVDDDRHVAGGHQLAAGPHQQQHQRQHDDREHRDGKDDVEHGRLRAGCRRTS